MSYHRSYIFWLFLTLFLVGACGPQKKAPRKQSDDIAANQENEIPVNVVVKETTHANHGVKEPCGMNVAVPQAEPVELSPEPVVALQPSLLLLLQ